MPFIQFLILYIRYLKISFKWVSSEKNPFSIDPFVACISNAGTAQFSTCVQRTRNRCAEKLQVKSR